jgi:general secretion pathway protein I
VRSRQRGFTLLEVLVATAIAGIAVAGLMGALSNTAKNANRLTAKDRAAFLAKSRMDELIVDHKLPRGVPHEGLFDPTLAGGVAAGWRARVIPFEMAPNAGPGMWVVDRIELEVWWMEGATRRAFTLEAFRRGIL